MGRARAHWIVWLLLPLVIATGGVGARLFLVCEMDGERRTSCCCEPERDCDVDVDPRLRQASCCDVEAVDAVATVVGRAPEDRGCDAHVVLISDLATRIGRDAPLMPDVRLSPALDVPVPRAGPPPLLQKSAFLL
jgi:hypothetical protein